MNRVPGDPPAVEVASRSPARELWIEMNTRVITRGLHFRSGLEEKAVASVFRLFDRTRKLMTHNPDARQFEALALRLLEVIRPYTSRWQSAYGTGDRFRNPAQRRQFRAELQELQVALGPFVSSLARMMGEDGPAGATPPALETCTAPFLGKPIEMGVERPFKARPTSLPKQAKDDEPGAEMAQFLAMERVRDEMNQQEREHVYARRAARGQEAQLGLNGVGLALSGGGIRSATFCLGVVQVLAAQKLLPKFDYLSTVSGGGYFGAFLSNQFTDNAASDTAFASAAVDSAQVRHLRNHSSYLLPTTLLSRISLGGLLVSGVLTTTLLAMAIPVSFALLVRIFARFGAFDAQHPLDAFGYYWQPFALLGTVAATVALLCWLLRPITAVWRNAHRSVDVVATVGCLGAAAAFALAATPWLLDLVTRFAHWRLASVSITGATILASGAFTVKAVKVLWPYRRLISRIFIASGVVLFAVVYLATIQYLGLTPGESSWTTPEIVVCAALAVWVLWAAALNLNLTGLHRYYRDGLASCYLQSPEPPREGLAHPPPLEALSADLPYHLINTTVNLAASPNAELRGRGGDFFLLSKFYCGSPIAGYQSTRTVHAMNPDLDLATAVAISGAAASANMGWQTMREYRVLMAIFNVRLGYWLRWRKGSHGWLASNAFTQLTREMLGLLREEASSLNLSDGGHIENLAAYELIRRKMKFIVCVDGGMDGEMTCADLNRLQRLALIDFGYRLEFDDSDLRLTDGFSTNYGILVKIDYTPDQPDVERKQLGWMLYMKLAMLGTEPNYVLDYRREQPLFPHQSTMDQFFDESQFEAYRKLGECAAKNFLSDEFGTRGVCGFEEWFANLAQSLLRDTDEVYLRDDAARNDPDIGDGLERARARATRRPVSADGPGN